MYHPTCLSPMLYFKRTFLVQNLLLFSQKMIQLQEGKAFNRMAQSTFNEPGRNNKPPFPFPSQGLQRTFVGITLGPLLADLLLQCLEFLSTFCGEKNHTTVQRST